MPSTDITLFQSYWCILGAFCWIGLGKGLRTVFMNLVIPSHVPLKRLPAACGLQLVFAGIFFFFMGPVVGESLHLHIWNGFGQSFNTQTLYLAGYIRDRTNYVVTLHSLNVITYFVVFCWMLEKFYRDYQARSSSPSMVINVGQRMKQFITPVISRAT